MSEAAPMSQFSQVAREMLRLGGAGVFDAEEIRDTLREKFDLPVKSNDEYFRGPTLEVDLDLAHASQEADEFDSEEYEDVRDES